MKWFFALVLLALSACGHPADEKKQEPAEVDGCVCNECECDEEGDCFCTGCECPTDCCDGDDCALGACDCPEGCECGCADEAGEDDAGKDPGGGDGGCSGGSCQPFVGCETERYSENMIDRIGCL